MNAIALIFLVLVGQKPYYWFADNAEEQDVFRIDSGHIDSISLGKAYFDRLPIVFGCSNLGAISTDYSSVGDSAKIGEWLVFFGRKIIRIPIQDGLEPRFVVWDSIIGLMNPRKFLRFVGQDEVVGYQCDEEKIIAYDIHSAKMVNWSCSGDYKFPTYSNGRLASNTPYLNHPSGRFFNVASAIYRKYGYSTDGQSRIVYEDDTIAYYEHLNMMYRCRSSDTICVVAFEIPKRFDNVQKWHFLPFEFCKEYVKLDDNTKIDSLHY